jgi:hypothetical protein
MEWAFIVALMVAVPVILFPAAAIWLLNIGGVFAAYRLAREKRNAARASPGTQPPAGPHMTPDVRIAKGK